MSTVFFRINNLIIMEAVMKISKTKYSLNVESVLSLIESYQEVFENSQVAVTSREGGDNLFDGIGRIVDYKNILEKEFCNINDLFIGTDIERLLNQLKQDGLAYGRVRIMSMPPGKTYSYHMDCETRLHFALKTNDKCMLIVDDEVFRVPSDKNGYIVNTTLPHTAINASSENRIHLVIDLLYPVQRKDDYYIVQNEIMDEEEFGQWLVKTKPPTEPQRMDFYFT
jgi:hypothetical protein